MSFLRPATILTSLALLGTACSSTPTVMPTKNLERPTDITFVCLGTVASATDEPPLVSGLAMEACHPRRDLDPAINDASGRRTLGTFAFITNPGRAELAVADMDRGRLLDLAPRAPGYGMLPVGGEPSAITASQDGCWVAITNRTSCDLSLLDPSRLLVDTFATNNTAVAPATGTGEVLRHLAIRTGSGRTLRATTGEVTFLPPAQPAAASCQLGASPRAVATFPGCDLVAVLDLSFENGTATIASSYYVRPDLPGGAQPAGSEPVCPADCESGTGSDETAGGPDGGSAPSRDGSVPGAYQLQPLALVPDGSRVFVAGVHDTAVTAFDLGADGLGNPVRTELAEFPDGVSRLRLAIDPYLTEQVTRADGSTAIVTGTFLRNRGASFLYAFTADDSVRVLTVDGPRPVECDVNLLVPPERKTEACLPVGTPGLQRRPLAKGPGIRIPTFTNADSQPPLPRDIAFADFQPAAGDRNYHSLSGQFGFLLGSNGQVYVLNLAPNGEDGLTAPPNTSCTSHLPSAITVLPAVATNSFRETRDPGQCVHNPLTVAIAPQRTVLQSDQAFATTATFSNLEGPLIQPANGGSNGWFGFPDPDSSISQKWDVTWEGVLSGTARTSGTPLGPPGDPSAGQLRDRGANFCASSVQPGDILMFAGCNWDSECQPDNEFSCQVSVSGARGMCLPIDAKASAQLIEDCARFMGSRMRYEVARAEPTTLTLRLKLDEVPKTTLKPCAEETQVADCRPDSEHRAFTCVEVLPQERRCVQRCSKDSECRAGHVCENVPWVQSSGGSSFCVEAPPIDATCFPQPMTSYSVRAGHGFVVQGSTMPNLHTGRVAEDGSCRYDVTTDPSLVDRIPLSAPRCPDAFLAPASGPAPTSLVQQLPAMPGSNPCLYQGGYQDASAAGTNANQPVSAYFQNPQISFVLTNLDRYAGDLLSIHFEFQLGTGFVPLTAQTPYEVLLTMGTRILLGPTKTPESPLRQSTGDTNFPYLYVVDQGRAYLTPASRGQVLRINARAGSSEIVTFDTTYSGSTPFQLQ